MRFRRHISILWRLFEKACVGYVCIGVPLAIVFERSTVISGSMSPALKGTERAGDTVLVNKVAYRFRAPRRGELVSFTGEFGEHIIKRVVAFPGEIVQIADGKVVVNGNPVTEPFVFCSICYVNAGVFKSPKRRFRVRPGHYFALGDFSGDSHDSRYWGGLRGDKIRGRAVAIISPWLRIRLFRASGRCHSRPHNGGKSAQ